VIGHSWSWPEKDRQTIGNQTRDDSVAQSSVYQSGGALRLDLLGCYTNSFAQLSVLIPDSIDISFALLSSLPAPEWPINLPDVVISAKVT
jgi:hypothetical protein